MQQENNINELLNKIRKINKSAKQSNSYKSLFKQVKNVHRTADEEIQYIIQEEKKHRMPEDLQKDQ